MRRNVSFEWTVVLAIALFALGVYMHVPYGGGRVYSDIVTVFQLRECLTTCRLPVPYIQAFIEYPVVTAMFMYAMGVLGSLLPGGLLQGYYFFSYIGLLAITLLLVRELRMISVLRGVGGNRLLWFFVVTPTFVIALLVNWYVIGTFFTVAGIRLFLQGKKKLSGVLLGLSAASNLVTVAPALGLLLSEGKKRSGAAFVLGGVATWGAINLPFLLLNPTQWFAAWQWSYNWYVEGSWMLLLIDIFSPVRHYLSVATFTLLLIGILLVRFKLRERDPVKLAFLATSGFLFSTYVFTPQMFVLLLPFLVVLPVPGNYAEFIVFDALNAFVVLAFSGTWQLIGINHNFISFDPRSPVQLAAAVRSLWVGKIAVYDGIFKTWNKKKTERPSLETGRLRTVKAPEEPYVPVSSLSLEDPASEPPMDSPTT
ncbi:MAG: hypothetical protein LYZ66_04715 [Nitrososphaerales archaeon]|nr:hypothetical protein [Nitrososphaerales archaeon]